LGAGRSFGHKIQESGQTFSEKISQGTESVKSKLGFGESKENLEEGQEESLENLTKAPTHKAKPGELRGFQEVKTGFSESVKEFKEEKRLEEFGYKKELVSDNPFAPLTSSQANLAQPLDKTEIVGGNLVEMTTGEKEILAKLEEERLKSRTLTEKMREGFIEAETKLSDKWTEAKERIKSTFTGQEKEKENLSPE